MNKKVLFIIQILFITFLASSVCADWVRPTKTVYQTGTPWPITGYMINDSGSLNINETKLNYTISSLTNNSYVRKAGDTMTGGLQIDSTITETGLYINKTSDGWGLKIDHTRDAEGLGYGGILYENFYIYDHGRRMVVGALSVENVGSVTRFAGTGTTFLLDIGATGTHYFTAYGRVLVQVKYTNETWFQGYINASNITIRNSANISNNLTVGNTITTQNLNANGNGSINLTGNITAPNLVYTSTKDDLSDIDIYEYNNDLQSEDVYLVNITGSGTLLGGAVNGYYTRSDPADALTNYKVLLTIDGTEHDWPITTLSNSVNSGHQHTMNVIFPPIHFNTSLVIYYRNMHDHFIFGQAFVKMD